MPPTKPTPSEAEARMRELLREGGLAEPDRVVHDHERDELVLFWDEPELAVVVELDG